MKYRVPDRLSYVATEKFLDSLPAEFEIVPEGHVCVKWPKEYTRERMIQEADFAERTSASNEYRFASCAQALRALAAIAPEPKKRKVELWKHKEGSCIWRAEGEWRSGDGWRKVAGPIEIED